MWVWKENQGFLVRWVKVKMGLSSEDGGWTGADTSQELRGESGLEMEIYGLVEFRWYFKAVRHNELTLKRVSGKKLRR